MKSTGYSNVSSASLCQVIQSAETKQGSSSQMARSRNCFSIFNPSPDPQSYVKREPDIDTLLSEQTLREVVEGNSNLNTSTSTQDSGPPKKRRRVRPGVEVVLPTLREIDGKRRGKGFIKSEPSLEIVKEEDKKDYANRLVKEEASISADVIYNRLPIIGYDSYDIKIEPPEIIDATTTREFTSTTWGGNRIWTFPRIQKDRVRIHGLNDFMFCNLEYNPACPQWPGAPGLYFDPENERSQDPDWPQIQRLLIRLKDNEWRYLGQYRLTPAPPLTKEEWRSQTDIVKKTWAENLSFRTYGRFVRAKIALRRLHEREVSVDEISRAMESNDKFALSADEVRRAFNRGETHLQVWYMKCIGYDEDFQRQIAAGN
ncbi:hypothetical protein BJ138DRAFT_663508 [Hygrophoropsis aurantiaca]|uniref:Uncharacterized protein n=1 Tax=Hygrophoropsis aurantiaca TaxID=72124 RepID=A0ACB8AKD9_9AGAM|nr:hypothetical protein BJ138DRAFT_663508 [Hygrophoropsis aurantiaca]